MSRFGAVLVLTLLLAPSTAPAAPSGGPEGVVDAFHAALHAGDTAGAARLLDESAVVFEQGGAERTRARYVAAHLPADAVYSATTLDETTFRSVQTFGELAYVLSEGRTSGAYNGKPVNRATTETMILRRFDDGWRIVHVHWSSAAARMSAASPAN